MHCWSSVFWEVVDALNYWLIYATLSPVARIYGPMKPGWEVPVLLVKVRVSLLTVILNDPLVKIVLPVAIICLYYTQYMCVHVCLCTHTHTHI